MEQYDEIFETYRELVFRHVKKGLYEISDLGTIRNVNTGKEVATCESEKGYSMVSLYCEDGRQHTFKLHRIVASVFLGDRSGENLEVDHKDGNKRNNSVDNLEWVTHMENIRRANEKALIPYKSGTEMYNSKFTEKDIRFICAMLEQRLPTKLIRKICKRAHVDVTNDNISDIRRRRNYKDITIDYKY